MATPGFPYQSFPKGWFSVCDSDDLGTDELKTVHYFGRDLILFRGATGEPHVLDAHCPHLGAHLGHGGTLVENTVRCPFHAWRFDGSGRCVEVPYATKIPPRAALRSWEVFEGNGMIMVWYHPEGKPPEFQIPLIPEWGSDEWSEPQRREFKVRSNPMEMAENTVDDAHFKYVHGTNTMPESTSEIDNHILRVTSISKVDTPRGEQQSRIEIASHGLGFGCTRFTGVIETLVIISGAAIDEDHSVTTLRFMVKKLGNADAERGVGKAFIHEIDRQFSQDTPIWENKIHLQRPVLCDGDGPIMQLRKWAKQFYLN